MRKHKKKPECWCFNNTIHSGIPKITKLAREEAKNIYNYKLFPVREAKS